MLSSDSQGLRQFIDAVYPIDMRVVSIFSANSQESK